MATDMASLKTTFGERVRESRCAKEMSQAALADKLGMQQSRISDIEAGRYSPTLETVERIAEALGVKAKALLS